MTTTDPLRREHAELMPRVEELRTTAETADVLGAAALATELDHVLAFLRDHLVPHAHAEEVALYPAVDRALGAPGATATMSRDHVEVLRLVAELGDQRDRLDEQPLDENAVRAIQRVLYGLYAVLHLHFAKEEEVYLPLLDAALSPDDATALFAAMGAAAHATAR